MNFFCQINLKYGSPAGLALAPAFLLPNVTWIVHTRPSVHLWPPLQPIARSHHHYLYFRRARQNQDLELGDDYLLGVCGGSDL